MQASHPVGSAGILCAALELHQKSGSKKKEMRFAMGGIGSGRPGWRSRVEDMLALDFRGLKKSGHLIPGKSTHGWLKSPFRKVEIHMAAQPHVLLIRLRHAASEAREEGWTCQSIPLGKMGRNRLCALCPKCGRSAQILYSGGRQFWCKKCHELGYASQFVGAEARARKRLLSVSG